MRTLLFCLKAPGEAFRSFNQRLADACQRWRPTSARCGIVGSQPKVELMDAGDPSLPALRVAVCPLDAQDDQRAAATEHHLASVIETAQGQPVVSVDAPDAAALVTLLVWPLDGGGSVQGTTIGVADSATTVPTPGGGGPPPATDSPPPAATPGRPPLGFRKRKGELIEDPDEAVIVRAVLTLLDAGTSGIEQIVDRLRADHGRWLREHWQPRLWRHHIRQVVDRADFYRAALAKAAAPKVAP